jgi:hypothetical protein
MTTDFDGIGHALGDGADQFVDRRVDHADQPTVVLPVGALPRQPRVDPGAVRAGDEIGDDKTVEPGDGSDCGALRIYPRILRSWPSNSRSAEPARKFTNVAEVPKFRDFGPYRRRRLTDRIVLMGFENLDGGREVVISTTRRSAEPPP